MSAKSWVYKVDPDGSCWRAEVDQGATGIEIGGWIADRHRGGRIVQIDYDTKTFKMRCSDGTTQVLDFPGKYYLNSDLTWEKYRD
jgi:hypothetical protein